MIKEWKQKSMKSNKGYYRVNNKLFQQVCIYLRKYQKILKDLKNMCLDTTIFQ
jgi:phage-related holin